MNIQSLPEDEDLSDFPSPTIPEGISVEISDTQSHLNVDPQALTRLVSSTLAAEGVNRATISIALVDNSTIHDLNRRHLGHDWPTDIITFPLSDPDEPILSGELVISAEMAATTADQAGIAPWDELALYVVHGLLHLTGYDDTDLEDRAMMRQRETAILALAGLSNTYPAVTGAEHSEPAAGMGRESVRCKI